MAQYRDPYSGYDTNHDTDNARDFNPYPYSNAQQQHPTYEHGDSINAYDNNYTDEYRNNSEKIHAQATIQPAFGSLNRTPRSARSIKKLRFDEQGQLWTSGSRPRCIGRFFCCSLLSFVFLLVAIVLALALWVNPPNVVIGDVQVTSSGGSQFQITNDGLKINLQLPITVDNPNYFQVAFSSIKADLTYPINNTPIGGGESEDVVFKANTANQNWTFPFSIEYKQSTDPGNQVLSDLARRCGVGGSKSDVTVKYKITLGLRILFVTIHPSITNQISFDCPVDVDDISRLLGGSGFGGSG